MKKFLALSMFALLLIVGIATFVSSVQSFGNNVDQRNQNIETLMDEA